MAQIYDILRVGKKALDYYASKLTRLEKSTGEVEFLREDIERLSEKVKVAQKALGGNGDTYFVSKLVKENKEILCLVVDQYVGVMEKAKSEYWNELGLKPELLEKEIALAREVKADVCS